MKVKPMLLVGLLLALTSIAPAGAAPASGARHLRTSAPPRGRILVIAAPRLTWETVQRVKPKHLDTLFERSAVASLSVRAAEPRTTPGAGYLTLGAGNRAAGDSLLDGIVVDSTEPYQQGSAVSAYRRATGIEPTEPILVLGIARLQRINTDEENYGTKIGALGSSLVRGGRSVAVIGNADQDLHAPFHRQVGLAAMDRSGQVAAEAVDDSILEVDDRSPFGIRLNQSAVLNRFDKAWASSDVVIVELSDLERAEAAQGVTAPSLAGRQFDEALRGSDQMVGELLSRVDLRRDRVMVVGPTSPVAEPQLTVFSLAAPEVPSGWATSSTTRRVSYVTLTDIAPTILDVYGIGVPKGMNNTRISTVPDDAGYPGRVERMVDDNARAVVRDNSFGVLTVLFIAVLVLDLILGVLCLARFRRLTPIVALLALVVLAVPVIAFASGMLPLAKFSTTSLGLLLFGGGLCVAGILLFALRIRSDVASLMVISALWLILALDIVTGGHLQINTTFGYSPIVAGRFAGFGNQAFSLFAIAVVVLVTALWERSRYGDGKVPRWFMPVAVLFFGLSVLLDGLPAFGSDVGGVLALVPTAALTLLMLSGRRIRVRTVLAIALGTVAVIAGFAAIDLSRPPDQRTHLGRFVASISGGEGADIIQRKLEANLAVLRSSAFSWVIPVALLYFAYLAWRPNPTMRAIEARHAGFRVMGIAGLVLGVLATLLNDSGVSMPAMMLAIALSYTNVLAVRTEAETP